MNAEEKIKQISSLAALAEGFAKIGYETDVLPNQNGIPTLKILKSYPKVKSISLAERRLWIWNKVARKWEELP